MMIINFFVVWLINERRLTLFLAGTIVRGLHHNKIWTRREQHLNLRITFVQDLF